VREFDRESDSFTRIRPKGGDRRDGGSGRREAALDDAFAEYAAQFWPQAAEEAVTAPEVLPDGVCWTTWDQSSPTERGPLPHPDWVITELGAQDTELGIVKTGKEADVFLLERAVPGTGRRTLLAAKRYRDGQHRMFHRDAGYLEGRRHKESRVSRAMEKRTAFGRQAIAGQWAAAEFGALCGLYEAGAAVPYPVQIVGTEILMEFIGDEDGTAAPRLAQLRPEPDELEDLWWQLGASLSVLARAGHAHGDLSAYNILVDQGRLVLIDVPQIVDVIANPQGRGFLERDVRNVGAWFRSRGLHPDRVAGLLAELALDAGLD
jgi:RIO kinase 1